MAEQLKSYKQKRNFKKTAEPAGSAPDTRTTGPTMDPEERRLAMPREDHTSPRYY
jgi:hypothetical protein